MLKPSFCISFFEARYVKQDFGETRKLFSDLSEGRHVLLEATGLVKIFLVLDTVIRVIFIASWAAFDMEEHDADLARIFGVQGGCQSKGAGKGCNVTDVGHAVRL